MRTYIPGEDYCAKDSATLNYGSVYFDPMWWEGDLYHSLIYSISGFPNNAYIPFPSGWSRTQGDIYLYNSLKYNDRMTYQYWPNH